MTSDDAIAIDRWADPVLADSPGWTDETGRTPVSLYREYLQRRRDWEQRAWNLDGSRDPRFASALLDLARIHDELSTAAPMERRDRSVAKPPSRDARNVRMLAVERSGDTVLISTLEEEFAGLPAITYRVNVVRVDGRWRLKERLADHGAGRRLRML